VEWDEDASKEDLVLFLERECKTVDDGSQDFEQLGDTIVALSLINELEENVVDGSANEGTKIEEFAINSMESGFQKVAFPGILRVEEFQQVEDKRLIDVALGNVRVEIGTLDESQEEFVYDLKMGPGELKDGLVFFRVERITGRIHRRRY